MRPRESIGNASRTLDHIQRHQAVGDKPKHLSQYLMIRAGFCRKYFEV